MARFKKRNYKVPSDSRRGWRYKFGGVNQLAGNNALEELKKGKSNFHYHEKSEGPTLVERCAAYRLEKLIYISHQLVDLFNDLRAVINGNHVSRIEDATSLFRSISVTAEIFNLHPLDPTCMQTARNDIDEVRMLLESIQPEYSKTEEVDDSMPRLIFRINAFRIILYNIAEGIINIAKVFIYEVDDNNESKSETRVKLKSLNTALEKLIRDFPPAFYGVRKFPCSEAFKNLYQTPVHSNFVKGLIKRNDPSEDVRTGASQATAISPNISSTNLSTVTT
uniref:Uncharacterized protein n=1 Tax=Acrobeloides nanus TaxID=290746 RepID=A0A914DDG8_9BILA